MSEDHPIIFWAEEREREQVYENDLRDNYELVRDYLLEFGHTTPLPDLSYHQALSSL